MEKTLKFSVLKEKIINTDVVLHELSKRNEALQKSQEWIQSLRRKLVLSKNEIDKLKSRNEVLTSAEKHYVSVTAERDELKLKFNELENTINNVHIRYQATNQELIECKEKLVALEEAADLEESLSVKRSTSVKRSPVKRKKSLGKKEKICGVQRDGITFGQLRDEREKAEKVCIENAELRLELYELKKKLKNVNSLEGEEHEDAIELKNSIELKDKELDRLSKEMKKMEKQNVKLQTDNERLTIENSLSQKEMTTWKEKCAKTREELARLRKQGFSDQECKLTAVIESKNKEIHKLSKEIENLSLQNSDLTSENEKLREENCACDVEISRLHGCAQNEVGNEEPMDMVRDMYHGNANDESKQIPKAPSKELGNEELEDMSLDARQVNPNTQRNGMEKVQMPLCSRKNSLTPTDEEIYAIMNEMHVPPKIMPMTDDAHCEKRNSAPLNGERFSTPAINLKEIVNRRRLYRKKQRQKAKKKLNRGHLYDTLLALKSANISFIISSNPFIRSNLNLMSSNHSLFKSGKFKSKKPKTVTEELKCSLACCTNTYMVLRDCSDDEDSPLLGFVGVKNETSGGPLSSKVNENIEGSNKNPKASITDFTDDVENELVLEEETNPVVDVSQDESCKDSQIRDVNERLQPICDSRDEDSDSYAAAKKSPVKQARIATRVQPPSIRKNSKNLQIVDESRKKSKPLITNCTNDVENELVSDGTTISVDQNRVEDCRMDDLRITNADKRLEICEDSADKSPVKRRGTRVQPLTVRKSERNIWRNPVASVIKKKKVQSKKNSLAITQCPLSYLDVTKDSSVDVPAQSSVSKEFIFKKPTAMVRSPKTSFKRPICSTRRSQRLATVRENDEISDEEETREASIPPLESPKSPTPERQGPSSDAPVIIPLEQISESVEKMPTTKIEKLFSNLILYSEEEEALNEVVQEFSLQEPEYIAEAVLERISVDYHEAADTKYHPAPLMTHAQRTMLGFMSKLENTCTSGVLGSCLSLAEHRLLTCDHLQELIPVTRLYLAVCKLKKKLTRMRKMCCDVFFFCGDLAVPFLFIVLTSWPEVLPHARDAKDFPLARVLVQIVYTRSCSIPGYNLMPLRKLLIDFYGYPNERWDYDEFFKELLDDYLRNPSRLTDFPLVLYCRSRPEKWVYEKIEEHLKPMVSLGIQDNFKATLVILIGNLYNRFSSKSEVNYLPRIREWLLSLITGETPEVVKRCTYVSLNRLKKK